MKATDYSLNCTALSGEERGDALLRRIPEIYEDISQCLYAERTDKSMFWVE
jgi:hypothetical protein